jgi:DNA-directed RNA polymerase subunit RPC12/RpoP
MVTRTLHCPHCQSVALVRNGHAPNGKQLYRCRACGRQSRENPTPHVSPPTRREEILRASSRTQQPAWPHPHIRGFSHDCVQLDQKKGAQLPPLGTTLLASDPDDPTSTTLELDELWSFVLKKANDSWMRDCPLPKEPASGCLRGWGSEPAKRVSACGKPFQRDIATDIASPTSGRPTRR